MRNYIIPGTILQFFTFAILILAGIYQKMPKNREKSIKFIKNHRIRGNYVILYGKIRFSGGFSGEIIKI